MVPNSAKTGLFLSGLFATLVFSLSLAGVVAAQVHTGFETAALQKNPTGSYDTASGVHALSSNATGHCNTAAGLSALFSNTTGNSNTASGVQALFNNTTGDFNTASGVN